MRCLLVLLTHAYPAMNCSLTGPWGCGNSLVCADSCSHHMCVCVHVPRLPAPTLPTACARCLCCCILHRVNPHPQDVTLPGCKTYMIKMYHRMTVVLLTFTGDC